MMNLAERRIADHDLRAVVREERRLWAQGRGGSGLLTVSGTTYSAREATDLYINGRYFHDDPDKSRNLEELSGPIEGAVLRHLFLFAVDRAAGHVLNLAAVLLEAGTRGKSSRLDGDAT